jgi:type I restriction-modification system DNA methylase subunit
MKPLVKTMLEDILHVFTEKFVDPLQSWDRFIEFIATEARGSVFYELDHKFEWFHEDFAFANRVLKLHDSNLLSSDYYDHLGDLYYEFCDTREPPEKTKLIPYAAAEKIASVHFDASDEVKTIFLPYMSTGRTLMAVHRKAPKSLLFGSESDPRLYRIAYANLCIHDIHAAIINADNDSHELDISTKCGQENWRYANQWYDQQDNLVSKTSPIHAY